ncbi:hypothetical protein [Paraburkholderia sp. DGU8]|uniref:hypothetical protein n=1 Tax=Paraburkholderia sp. DGU8 TaxID=3161997 RepID=UPI003465EF8A
MSKLLALRAVAASLGGCAVAPQYEEAQPYNPVYDYHFYGPRYGTCSILDDYGAWGGWYGYGWGGGWHGGGGGYGGGGGLGGR